MGNFKKVILLDLDGVLNEYSGFFEKDNIPKIKNGAKDFLKNYLSIIMKSKFLLQEIDCLLLNG